MESELAAALVLGLLLGAKHSLDPDHVVAVSTIVTQYRNPLRACWVGTSWGLGHTTTLILVGLVIVGLRLQFPTNLALFFEFSVGVVLIILGINVLLKYRRRQVHVHAHTSPRSSHRHFHSHGETLNHSSIHHRLLPGKPFFRGKSYLVGTVHGLAGSAALMLLVLGTIQSPIASFTYIFLFGLGSMVAMGVLTICIAIPFAISAKVAPGLNQVVQLATGAVSVFFGAFVMYETGFLQGLFL